MTKKVEVGHGSTLKETTEQLDTSKLGPISFKADKKAPQFTVFGKQVKKDGENFCQAASDEDAWEIAEAMVFWHNNRKSP